MEIDDIVKELDERLEIIKKEVKKDVMYIYCRMETALARCTNCGFESSRIHSKYQREIGDLPIAQYKVKIVIEVKKYTCVNPKCHRKRFAEELPFAAERSKRTERLDEYIREIGLKNSSVEAGEIIRKTHADISNKTIIRILKKIDERKEV